MKNEEILKTLEPMFKNAEREGLWFYSAYQDLWFSPKELRQLQSEGRFVWGPPNWQLRNPKAILKERY